MYCPNCGQKIPNPAGDWLPTKTFESTAMIPGQTNSDQAGQPSFSMAYRKTPWRKPEFAPDVLIPLSQSVISGLLSAIVMSIAAIFIKSWPPYLGLLAFPVVVALGWLLSMVSDRGLWIIEKITGTDQDDDEPKKKIIEIEVKNDHTRHIAELPGDEEYLRKFCQWVAAGDSFSESTAQKCGYGVTNFRNLRDIFVSRRWGLWKNADHPQQGIELTVSGKQIIRSLAATPPPYPTDAQITTR